MRPACPDHLEQQNMSTKSVAPSNDPALSADLGPETDSQFVVCVVADERYGIQVDRVHEIIRLPAITALPGADLAFSGVINLRGRVIPVMDLRLQLGLPAAPPTRLSRIVVADTDGAQIGLVVDAVNEVVRIQASAIEATPALTATAAAEHLTGIARMTDGLIILLDLERLLASLTTNVVDATEPEPGAAA
jgi:purine-binding chemotaxis protein CheW